MSTWLIKDSTFFLIDISHNKKNKWTNKKVIVKAKTHVKILLLQILISIYDNDQVTIL